MPRQNYLSNKIVSLKISNKLTIEKSKLDMSSVQLYGSHTPAKRGVEAGVTASTTAVKCSGLNIKSGAL